MCCQVVNGAIPAFACLVYGASVVASDSSFTSASSGVFCGVFCGVVWSWWRLVCYPLYLLTTMFLVGLSDTGKASKPRRGDWDLAGCLDEVAGGRPISSRCWWVPRIEMDKIWIKFGENNLRNWPWPMVSTYHLQKWWMVAGSLPVNSWAFLCWWAVARHQEPCVCFGTTGRADDMCHKCTMNVPLVQCQKRMGLLSILALVYHQSYWKRIVTSHYRNRK